MTHGYPFAVGDGHDFPWLINQRVPGVAAVIADLGQDIPPREQQTPEALGAFQKAVIEKWWPIIKAANNKGE